MANEVCQGCTKNVFGRDWLHVGSRLMTDGQLINAVPDPEDELPTMALMAREGHYWMLFEPKLPKHATEPLIPLMPDDTSPEPTAAELWGIYNVMRQAFRHAISIGVLARDSSGQWHYAEDESKTDIPEGTVIQ